MTDIHDEAEKMAEAYDERVRLTITLTLQSIRDAGPCAGGWTNLLRAIGQSANPDLSTRIGIGDVLLSNGRDDALWCLRCLTPRERVSIVMPAVKRASTHTSDQRVHDCISAVDRWLAGDDTVDLTDAAAWVRAAAAARGAADAAAWARAAAAARASAAAGFAAARARAAAEARGAAAAEAAREAAAAGFAAAWAADDTENARQHADILRLSPPLILKGERK